MEFYKDLYSQREKDLFRVVYRNSPQIVFLNLYIDNIKKRSLGILTEFRKPLRPACSVHHSHSGK